MKLILKVLLVLAFIYLSFGVALIGFFEIITRASVIFNPDINVSFASWVCLVVGMVGAVNGFRIVYKLG